MKEALTGTPLTPSRRDQLLATLAERLKKWRRINKLNADQAAARLGVSRAQIYNYEKQEKAPDIVVVSTMIDNSVLELTDLILIRPIQLSLFAPECSVSVRKGPGRAEEAETAENDAA